MGARRICAPWTCSSTLYLALLIPDCAQPSERQLYGESLNQNIWYLCFKCAKLILKVLMQELLITLSACKTASARKVTAVLPVRVLGRVCSGFISHSRVALPLLETEWYLYSSYSMSHLRLSDTQTSRIQRAARHCQRLRTVSTSRTSPIRKCAADPVCTVRRVTMFLSPHKAI